MGKIAIFDRPRCARIAALPLMFGCAGALGGSFASAVVSYEPGAAPTPGYSDPQTALGSPERFTGEMLGFPSVVSVFSPPFGADELVSVGEGGHLTVRFDAPIVDSPAHSFGVDLIVFGNGGFADDDYPNGRVSTPALAFGLDASLRISVSADGVSYSMLPETYTEGFFPAQGYLDAGPYDATPGTRSTDFARPVNPGLSLADFAGLRLPEVQALYDGSGGGTPIDIGAAGLGEVSYVRVEVLDDLDPLTERNVEIDALVAVPEPATLVCVLGLLALRTAFRKGV